MKPFILSLNEYCLTVEALQACIADVVLAFKDLTTSIRKKDYIAYQFVTSFSRNKVSEGKYRTLGETLHEGLI